MFEKHGFCFKDSGTGPSVAAGAWILFASTDVQIHLSYERGEIMLSLRSLYDTKKTNWFSIDLISRFLGRNAETGLMDEANSKFFADNIDRILAEFRQHNAQSTIIKLNQLKNAR